MYKLGSQSRLHVMDSVSDARSENTKSKLTTTHRPIPADLAIAVSSSNIPQSACPGTLWGNIAPAFQNGAPTLWL